MDQEKGKFVRRNYFINKKLQLKFSVLIFITTLVIGIIAVWTTYVTTWNEVAKRVQEKQFYAHINSVYEKSGNKNNAEMVNAVIVVEFSEIFDKVSSSLVLRLLIGSFILFILSIFASHKIAGPLYRLENAAQSICDGDLSVDISKLRDGDELTDLAKAINGAITKLRMLIDRYRNMAGKLTELASKISSYEEGGKAASEESGRLIKELEVVSNQLVTEINYFTTKKITAEKKEEISQDEGITHY